MYLCSFSIYNLKVTFGSGNRVDVSFSGHCLKYVYHWIRFTADISLGTTIYSDSVPLQETETKILGIHSPLCAILNVSYFFEEKSNWNTVVILQWNYLESLKVLYACSSGFIAINSDYTPILFSSKVFFNQTFSCSRSSSCICN